MLPANNALLGILMIAIGLSLTAGGAWVLSLPKPQVTKGTVLSNSAPSSDRDLGRLSNQDKGRQFEEWIVKKFNPAYFGIKEWRSDKYVNGIYPESSVYPDLEIEFRLHDGRSILAVECKWRRDFLHDGKTGVEWATPAQILNYQRFQQERRIPVFVVIGIGGEPNKPAELYIVPLDRLRYPFASSEYLAKFRRTNTNTNFYYDSKQSELR